MSVPTEKMSVPDQVLFWFEKGGKWWALAVFIVLLVFLIRDLRRSFALLGRMRRGKSKDGILDITGTVLLVAAASFPNLKELLRRVRMLVEHEMFSRPGRVNIAALGQARSENIFHEDFQAIFVENAAEVNARFGEIDLYFETLAKLNISRDRHHFICPIEIQHGFVSPLHLLTGLLVEFDQKWNKIIGAFNRDASKPIPGVGDLGGDIREIQMFIYTCWLLWGPSIPRCKCGKSVARFRNIQYGFGDENNSLDVVGAAPLIDSALAELLKAARDMKSKRYEPGVTPEMPMALPANVRGRLRLSSSIKGDAQTTNAFATSDVHSWSGGQDRRPVLFLSTIKQGDVVRGNPDYQSADIGRLTFSQETVRSKYYSAYLWIAFVMMEETEDGVLVPLSQARGGTSQPWTDLVPFFEHGNLADTQSCAYGKRQLAAKVVEALTEMAAASSERGRRTRFVFACSIDESGCDGGLAFEGWQGERLIRDLVRERIDTHAPETKAIVILDPKGRTLDAAQAYSACSLPEHVAEHYASM